MLLNFNIRTLLKRTLQAVLACCLVVLIAFAYVAYSTYPNPLPDKLTREQQNTGGNIVTDVTELYPINVVDIVVPHRIEEIVDTVVNSDHVSIGGGRNSMGGQTASGRAVQIDMREYKEVLNFSPEEKEITIQAGARWRDVQNHIDPYDLSVKIMQTYANFTVGGSLSVNVHGRYLGLGPVIMSVKSFRIVLADGEIVNASPSQNADIFYSAIGGMGGIGVITDVTLELADNVNVRRSRQVMPVADYSDYFAGQVRNDAQVLFHNADMYPPDFDYLSAVNWSITDEAPTTESRVIPEQKDYWLERIAWKIMSEWPGGRWIRQHIIDPLVYGGDAPVHTRNYEASYDIAELEPNDRAESTYVLQEYFIPVERFADWVPKMKGVFDRYDVNVLNVSIRHALPDPGAKLAWARTEMFAFVVYYKQGTDAQAREGAGTWTRAMIDEALSVDGTYYLPYQPWATDQQFHRAYPGAIEYFEIKNRYDPTDKFTNNLWDQYYSPEKLELYQNKSAVLSVADDVAEYYRPVDNTYLSLPEWYIVYSADEYAAVLQQGLPSDFHYFQVLGDYWGQYKIVSAIVASSPHDNSDYDTVLNVIGWSYSIENVIKGLYENSIGRLTEWIAGNKQVAEDKYAALVASQYAAFIYEYPWYDFPYFEHFKAIWWLDHDVHHTGFQFVRRIERKLILSLEYGVKALYAKLIAIATHSKFGVQDDIVYAVITRDGGASYELVGADHYQPFSRLLLSELEQHSDNPEFEIADIAGNGLITLTYKDEVDALPVEGGKEVLRDPEIVGISNGQPVYQDRITLEVELPNIPLVYRALRAKNLVIDHFYDY